MRRCSLRKEKYALWQHKQFEPSSPLSPISYYFLPMHTRGTYVEFSKPTHVLLKADLELNTLRSLEL